MRDGCKPAFILTLYDVATETHSRRRDHHNAMDDISFWSNSKDSDQV